MVNDIIHGVSVKLYQMFGDSVRIYSENVKQGFKEPCFFISVLNPSQSPMIGTRYFRQHPLDILYFPAVPGSNSEMMDKASGLFEAFEYINLAGNGGMIRGTDMHYEKVDGVLHFFVSYNLYVQKVSDTIDKMETIAMNTDSKG